MDALEFMGIRMRPQDVDALAINIRWMIRRDMEEVYAIERASFANPWDADDFSWCLRQRNCIGMVAEKAGRVVGYMVYGIEKEQITIINFAVMPEFRREGVGRAMAAKLKSKISTQRRQRLVVRVSERNLEGQLFWRAMGFVCVKIVRLAVADWDCDVDAYEFDFLVTQLKRK